jgi:hypothetical protein
MKKSILLLMVMALVYSGFSQTADEVVNKFLAASGGKEKLVGIKTLQFDQSLKMKTPFGDFDVPISYIKDNGKFFRVQATVQMGPQSETVFTMINDTEGYVMVPANPFSGAEGGLKKMDDKERQSQAYQLDAMGYFAPLVNYAEKGSTVELLKDEKVNKEDCYKVKLTMKGGQELIYLVNKNSNLVVRMDAKGPIAAAMSGLGSMMGSMGGGRIDKVEVSNKFSAYKEIDGIQFPTKVVISSAMGDMDSDLSNIRINQEINSKWYKAE